VIQDDEKSMRLLAKSFTAWEKLTAQEQEELLRNTSTVRYQKGTNLHSGENDCLGVYVIKSGVLRIYILSEHGKEVTLYRLGVGDMCILSLPAFFRP
jgi:CRP/FNR family transcriptional regulator